MAKTDNLLLLVMISVFYNTSRASATTTEPYHDATSFIKTSCNSTTYPDLCVQSLWIFANKIPRSARQMAMVALYVCLSRTNFAKSFVSKLKELENMKPNESGAIAACLVLMGDSVDRLSESVQELRQLRKAKGRNYWFGMSNVKTWVSGALTNADTCLDGFEEMATDSKVKDLIRAKVVNVVQVTSNALSLINQLDQTH